MNYIHVEELTYTGRPGGVDEEYRDVDELHGKTYAVNGDDEGAVGVNEGEPVEHPHHAVQYRHDVRIRLESLHRLVLPYLHKRRPANPPSG